MTRSIIIVPSKLDKEDRERVRGLRAAECFGHLLTAAKEQIDNVNWYALGLSEAEAALEAWRRGSPHAFFDIWRERRGTMGANRAAPSTTEQEARRLAILLTVALERIGMGKHTSKPVRTFVAGVLEQAGIFTNPISDRTIEYWQSNAPELTPRDELTLATAIASCGADPYKLAYFFVGHLHLVTDPAVTVRHELT
jgi:hypothetical protein